jgi:hypothetical protein
MLLVTGLSSRAWAVPPYLDEAGIRAAIVGHTLDGHYGNGLNWTEVYAADGRLDYREQGRNAVGKWHFRPGDVFCTFYDPGPFPGLSGGCWLVLKSSANCFEFYVADEGAPSAPPEEGMPEPTRWNAQGWRHGEPSTCGEKPAV